MKINFRHTGPKDQYPDTKCDAETKGNKRVNAKTVHSPFHCYIGGTPYQDNEYKNEICGSLFHVCLIWYMVIGKGPENG